MQDVLDQMERATADVVAALESADLGSPSLLPHWSRLTVACHLRYGAEALQRMTQDTIAGRPTSYYPDGRATQRPTSLVPRDDESSADVVTSLRQESTALHEDWRTVKDWSIRIVEPPDNSDLGPVPLSHLALARLTEVEVHGTDLGLGLGPWSEVLVRHVLPMRLEWLNARRSNLREVDTTIRASWRLVVTDMELSHVVAVDGENVVSQPGDTADTTITGAGAELLSLLLGRAPTGFAPKDFSRALPGP